MKMKELLEEAKGDLEEIRKRNAKKKIIEELLRRDKALEQEKDKSGKFQKLLDSDVEQVRVWEENVIKYYEDE